jgi:hypothetical protein
MQAIATVVSEGWAENGTRKRIHYELKVNQARPIPTYDWDTKRAKATSAIHKRNQSTAGGRGIIFETAELRRIVRWCDDDTVGELTLATSVVAEDRMRDYRGGGVTIGRIDHHIAAVACQHFQCGSESACVSKPM